MARMRWIVWCGWVLLGFNGVVVYAASSYDTRRPGAAQSVLPDKDTEQSEAISLPRAGATEHFRYAQERENLYRITPDDGTPSYLVSESFLQATLADARLASAQQAEILQSYPALMQEMFANMLVQAYPDATTESAAPFTALTLDGTDGTSVLLEQDPVAAPYVRVRLSSATGGEGVEFSVVRSMVDQLLTNSQLTEDDVLRGLQDFPFRLPEAARRGNFERLSVAELANLVQQDPALQRHEIIQMNRLHGKEGGPALSSPETLQQKRLQAKQFREATSRTAEPSRVQRKTALSQQPSHTLAMDRGGEQPQLNAGAMVHGVDGLSQQQAASPRRSPVTTPTAPTAAASPLGVASWLLYISASVLFAVGIIVLVASLVRRKEAGIRQ